MANEVDYNPCQYKGNGVTRDFSFNWKVIEVEELIVSLELVSTGDETILTRGSDYTAQVNAVGGNVLLTTAPSEDYFINIRRKTSNFQSKGYSTSSGFQGSEIEKSFDKVSCCLQDMQHGIDTFKEEYTAETNQKIEDFEGETNSKITTNKSDTDKQIDDFKNEVNGKIVQVTEAVNQLNRLDEVIANCENYATTAEEQAIIADETVSGRATTSLNNLNLAGEKVLHAQADRSYQGVNLEEKFATEIAQYGNVYKWLEARKNAGNYDGIHVGDYFYTSLKAGTIAEYSITAQTFKCRIIGLNTYKNCGDSVIGNMIYVSTDEVINTPIKWNPADNNNGTNNRKSPWLASAMYAILNGGNNYDNTSGYNKVAHGANGGNGIISLLPTELQSVLKQKRNILDERYSASGLITGGTGWNWADMGKLWLPSEIEVYGTQIRSNLCQTDGYWNPEAGLSIQFPWFANSCEHRIKKRADGARCSWWLSSVASNNTANVCNVNNNGNANNNVATNATIYVPL